MARSDYRIRDVGRESVKGGVSAVTVGIVLVVVAVIVLGVGFFAFGWFRQSTADFRGETQKRDQVEGSGAYRIAAYDHFFDLCASVQNNEATIVNLEQELVGPPPASEARAAQIRATLTAVRNQRAASINEYNADARKEYTAGEFRDSDLPFKLDVNQKETTCEA